MKQDVCKILRFAYKASRRLVGKDDSWYYHHYSNISDVSAYIENLLLSDKPCLVARLGSVEYDNLSYAYLSKSWDQMRAYVKNLVYYCEKKEEYEENLVDRLCTFAGYFPNKTERLKEFLDIYLDAMHHTDLLGVWYNEDLFRQELMNTKFVPLGSLEPYDYANPWSRALAGKKVLVIHPFAKTIESQYARRELLFENKDVLPEFELITIKAVQSIAGEKTPFKDWFEALAYMKKQMDAIDYDVALIGCGAYGYPLAAYAKSLNKKALHLGGGTSMPIRN